MSLGDILLIYHLSELYSITQALLCLPEEERGDYRSLVGHATLLVEQLLINKKVLEYRVLLI